jgi:hypothetical protein
VQRTPTRLSQSPNAAAARTRHVFT